MNNDRELTTLCVDRRRLLREYGAILKRVGASHPDRSKINAARARHRGACRRALRRNAELIAARVMELIDVEELERGIPISRTNDGADPQAGHGSKRSAQPSRAISVRAD